MSRPDGVSRKEWDERKATIGYKDLYRLHFGEWEISKGCKREYDFAVWCMSTHMESAKAELSLRLEAEELLREHGIEPPSERRDREWREGFAGRQAARESA